jgi:hypothetical protein
MKAPLFYRIASILMIVFATGHTLLFSQVDPAWGVTSLVQAMKSIHFDAYGSQRSYWDFFVGFGLVVTALLVLASIVSWQFGALPAETRRQMRVSAWAFAVCFAGVALLAWRYFFTLPIILTTAIAVCLGIAASLSGDHSEGPRIKH